jgi:hypothetical protein
MICEVLTTPLYWRHVPPCSTPTRLRALRAPREDTAGEMRGMGLRGVLIYWPDDVRLSDIEPRFVCGGCGGRGSEVRPDFSSGKPP